MSHQPRLEQKPQLTTCKSRTSFLWQSQGLLFVACGRLEVWSQVLQVHAHATDTAGKLAGLTCRTLTAWRDALGNRGSPGSSALGNVPGWGCALHVGVSVLLEKNPGLFLVFSMR